MLKFTSKMAWFTKDKLLTEFLMAKESLDYPMESSTRETWLIIG